MGQQQLLITILVTIIIGIAIVVAINTMQQAGDDAQRAAMRQDILMVITDARQYYQKPTSLGGGNRSFDDISQDNILSIDPNNENGSYTISGSGNSVTVAGTGSNGEITLSATATKTADGMDISWSDS